MTVALRYLVRSACDGPFGSALTSSHYVDEGARVIRLGNIGNADWRDESAAYVPIEYWRTLERHHARAGDVVVAGLGDGNNPVGRAAVVPDIGPAMVKADCFRLRLDPDRADPRYLAYYMSSRGSQIASERSHGSTRQRLPLGSMLDIPVPALNLSAQRRIAEYLDTETARIDRLRAGNQELVRLVRERHERYVVTSVTEGVATDGCSRPVDGGWFTSCSSGFEVGPYAMYGRTGSGHTPSRSVPEYWTDCDTPWVTTGDVKALREGYVEYVDDTAEKISELGMENSAARLHPAGTVFLSRTASVGFAGIMAVPMATSQDFFTWTPDQDRLRSEYLLWALRAMRYAGHFDRLMYGSTHKTIYVPDLMVLRGPVPPVDEQDRIVHAIREQRDETIALLDNLERANRLLAERRQALITAAVTGEIEV